MTTILMLHAATPQGREWLRDQLPEAARQADALILKLEGGELDAVLFAEELRADAVRAGHRLSIGLAERIPGTSMTLTVTARMDRSKCSEPSGRYTGWWASIREILPGPSSFLRKSMQGCTFSI